MRGLKIKNGASMFQKFNIKEEHLTGQIKDFPIEVVQKMCEHQVSQGNQFNIKVFQEYKESGSKRGGFFWGNTEEGWDFWEEVIRNNNFNLFFEKYPPEPYIWYYHNVYFNTDGFDYLIPNHQMVNNTDSNLGVKYSSEKLEMSKIFTQFPDALKAVMLTSTFGHIKYKEFDEDWLNFKRVEGLSYEDALVRHQLLKSEKEEESKLHPKFHIAWNALADLQKYIEENNIEINELAKDKIKGWEEEFNPL